MCSLVASATVAYGALRQNPLFQYLLQYITSHVSLHGFAGLGQGRKRIRNAGPARACTSARTTTLSEGFLTRPMLVECGE